jgi:hypothetical protein
VACILLIIDRDDEVSDTTGDAICTSAGKNKIPGLLMKKLNLQRLSQKLF